MGRYGTKGSNPMNRLEGSRFSIRERFHLHKKPSSSASTANVWESVQRAADPNKVEVAAMKGKHLPRFSSQLVVRKPLIPSATLIPVFPPKRSSTSDVSASSSKRAKFEALAAITATTSNPSTH
ncbi:hypothetical protein LIER_41730 [Lithospermum erythrorhizon]|uniref:Uncharacterized protein n=1 Tax=Lithospermum erythrorhizon TaxID=34254 RepID=A0AAV3RJM8_LITER